MTDQILDQPDIRALIARAVADEPAYDLALGAALDAAVAGGRQPHRRNKGLEPAVDRYSLEELDPLRLAPLAGAAARFNA